MSYRSLGIGVAFTLGSWMSLSAALAENRVALVIGNSAYQSVSALPNPANDAKAMTELLQSAGFEVVSVRDLTQSDFRRTISQFANTLSGKGRDTVAAVFYAGHGLQVDGENYLVPIDANITREADVRLQAVRLADLMNALSAVPSKSRIVMLDACRNNPFSEINKVTGRGLAIVDAPAGSIVSYATSPGSEALDGDGANSPYTTALLSVAKEPGLPIEQAFKRVRFAVSETTRQQQLPWESSSLTSEFAFFPGQGTGTPATTPVSTASRSATGARAASRSVDVWKRELQRRPAREAYEVVLKEDTVEAYQAYLALFPGQPNSSSVRQVLDRRRVMVAWYTAVTVNTPASYQTFLASYANTDLGATALRLLDNANNRSLVPDVGQVASICPVCPQQIQQPTRRASRSTVVETPKKTATKTTKKTAKKTAKKTDDRPPRRRVARTPEPAPPPRAASVVPVGVPIGIGIGIGGIGRIGRIGGSGRGYPTGRTGGGYPRGNRPH